MEYITINEFALKDLFLESKELIPNEIMEKIKPYSRENSMKKWKELINSKIEGILFNFSNISLSTPILSGFNLDNQSEVNCVKKQLSELINLPEKSKVIFFWNRFFSVNTEWGIFLQYWSSFCRNHAEECILVFEEDYHILIYSDEGLDKIFWLEDKRTLFKDL